jgi:multiple sugar transport system substrate-binding protein
MAAGNVGGGGDVVFKTTKHPKEAAEFVSWLGTNTQNLDILIKGAGAVYPAALAGLALPSLNGPQPFFGNQVINEVFHPASTHIDYNFQWGPTMNQTFSDIQDDFANAINGKGTLTSELNTAQQQTVTFMQKQGFSVST